MIDTVVAWNVNCRVCRWQGPRTHHLVYLISFVFRQQHNTTPQIHKKVLYARAKPMGLPHIPDPTDEDVDKWHAKYCDEVRRLYNTYRERVPAYKHKKLFID